MAAGIHAINLRTGFCEATGIFHSKRDPVSLPTDEFLDVATFISSCQYPGTAAFIDASTGEKITREELWPMVHSLADALSDQGIRRGDVVFLLASNCVLLPVVCLAVLSLGAVLTTANSLSTAGDIAKQTLETNTVLAFTSLSLLPKLAGTQFPVILFDRHHDRVNIPGGEVPIFMIDQLISRDSCYRRRTYSHVRQDDTATILYSSGTTGLSKGVMSSHRSLIATVLMLKGRFRPEEGPHTFLCRIPMAHIYGLTVCCLGAITWGSTVVVLHHPGITSALEAIQNYHVTYFPAVPPVLVALLTLPDVDRYDLRSLTTILCGGAPLNRDVIDRFARRFPWVGIQQGYAMTETAGMGSCADTVQEQKRLGSCGMLSPNMEARVVDTETGETRGVNGGGELWLRGPCIMKGYLCNPEASAAAVDKDGWLRTGDLGYIDEDGHLFVVDRLKELIKYNGYQVPPAELEAILLAHPQIIDAAVIPFPDERVGQYPIAHVVRRIGSTIDEGSIMDFVAKQVAPYKKIRRIHFVDSIPKTPSGKILRKDLLLLPISSRL